MPKIDLHPKFGTPILTQTYPAVPLGSFPGTVIFKQPYPAIPPGSQPGTPLDIMVQTAALEESRIYQAMKLKKQK